MNLPEAYAACERLAASHYENFPVASRLLPRGMRPHIAAIYAFARAADDFADEGDATAAERVRQLDDWLGRLHEAVERGASAPATDPVFIALPETIRVHRLPVPLFDDLISAFRQDVTTARYETWDALLDYCRRSANPVGRLVLRVAGYDDSGLDAASDAVCTALQLTNFWQDVERDWQKGRVYAPADDRQRFGAHEEDLARRAWTPAWRILLAELAARTRDLFDAGRPVCDGVTGRLRLELRFTWLGGRRILDRLEAAGFDVFTARPSLGAGDVPAILWQAAAWTPAR